MSFSQHQNLSENVIKINKTEELHVSENVI